MNRECCIVGDLLPLYLEDLTAEETGTMIREHLKICPTCGKKLERLRENLPQKAPELPMHRLHRLLERRKLRLLLLTTLVVLLFAVAIFAWLSAPDYLSGQQAMPEIVETETGVYVALSTDAHHAACFRTEDGESGNVEYTIEAWRTALDSTRQRDGLQCICIPKTEHMTVWYTQHNGQPDICLYGHTEDIRYILPRLALRSYALLAAALAAALGAAALLCKRPAAKRMLCRMIAIPAAFLCGMVIVKGFDFTTYNLPRDMAMIALTAMVLLAIFWLILHRIPEKHPKDAI